MRTGHKEISRKREHFLTCLLILINNKDMFHLNQYLFNAIA